MAASLLRDASCCALDLHCDEASGRSCTAARTCEPGTLLCQDVAFAIALEPEHRGKRCGFCTAALDPSTCSACKACGLITVCLSCESVGARAWHSDEECEELRRLADGDADSVGSLVLLATRVILRRRAEASDERHAARRAVLDSLCTSQGMEELQAAGHGIAEICGGITAALDSPLHPARVLGACCVNTHALTDLTLPLGEQTLGLGLFLALSLFNHA